MLALHGDRVYVGQDGIVSQAALWSIASQGGEPQRVTTGVCGGLTVDDRFVFWTERHGGSVGRSEFAAGSPVTTLGGLVFAGRGPGDIVSDGSRIFWADVPGGEIRSASIDGADARVVASGMKEPTSLVRNATHVYWANYALPGAIWRSPLQEGDGTAEPLVSELPMPNALGLTPTYVYWVDGQFQESRIMRVALGGGAPETLANVTGAISLATDDKFVYWGESTGAIRRLPLEGGNAVVVAEGQKNPISIMVDATHVYWANSKGDNVVRLAKSDLPAIAQKVAGSPALQMRAKH
jgi:hypothetical protein